MRSIGFTGTEDGMTDRQYAMARRMIPMHEMTEFHHGDCIGADREAHDIVMELTDSAVVVHPPSDPKKRAFVEEGERVTILKEYPYLVRNWHIVEQCSLLIATPREMQEIDRSGTWATVRYAAKQFIPVLIIYPDSSTARRLNRRKGVV